SRRKSKRSSKKLSRFASLVIAHLNPNPQNRGACFAGARAAARAPAPLIFFLLSSNVQRPLIVHSRPGKPDCLSRVVPFLYYPGTNRRAEQSKHGVWQPIFEHPARESIHVDRTFLVQFGSECEPQFQSSDGSGKKKTGGVEICCWPFRVLDSFGERMTASPEE